MNDAAHKLPWYQKNYSHEIHSAEFLAGNLILVNG